MVSWWQINLISDHLAHYLDLSAYYIIPRQTTLLPFHPFPPAHSPQVGLCVCLEYAPAEVLLVPLISPHVLPLLSDHHSRACVLTPWEDHAWEGTAKAQQAGLKKH